MPRRWSREARRIPGLTRARARAEPEGRRARGGGRRAQGDATDLRVERTAFAGQPPQDAARKRSRTSRGSARSATACRPTRASTSRRRLHRVRLHAAGRGVRGLGDARWPRACARAGADTVGLSDTIGYAQSRAGEAPVRAPRARDRATSASAARTCTTRAGRGSPTSSPRSTRASPRSIRRRAASAAVPTRRAPPATSSPRISSSCSNRWGSTRASTSRS